MGGLLDMIWEGMDNSEKQEEQSSVIEEAVSVHYNKFNARGLNVVAMFFKRKGYPVKDIRADDKVRKKDGMPTKKVVFEFENGQKLEMLFAFEATGRTTIEKSLGHTFLAKVDGKKIPVSAQGSKTPQTAKTLDKIIGFLSKLAPDKTKLEQDRKKLLAASQAELKPDQIKKGPTSTAAKLKVAVAKREELTTLIGISQARMSEENSDNKALTKKHSQLESKLSGLTDTEASLQQELATLKSA